MQKYLRFAIPVLLILISGTYPVSGAPAPATDDGQPLGKKEVIRAILGLEQTGASGTTSGQNYLLDFFITRPAVGARVRWWGDVKVATFPQQINSQVATLEQQFA
jgi:hypothetical protein